MNIVKQKRKMTNKLKLLSIMAVFLASLLQLSSFFTYSTAAAPLEINITSAGVPKRTADNNAFKSILNGVYQIAGVIAVIVIIIGGIRFIVGGDNPDNVATARRMIIYASAGLVIIISAFVITQFVINAGST